MTINPVPDLVVYTITDITPQLLSEKGIKGMMIDLDNTLAAYSQREPSDKVIDWVHSIRDSGIKIGIISNNKQERVDKFNEKLGLIYNVADAGKPKAPTYIEVAKKMGLDFGEIVAVGDQIYTDVLGGNNVGMYTIMLKNKEYSWNILLAARRMLEMPFIKRCENRMKGKR